MIRFAINAGQMRVFMVLTEISYVLFLNVCMVADNSYCKCVLFSSVKCLFLSQAFDGWKWSFWLWNK